jgi:hypothetical protein
MKAKIIFLGLMSIFGLSLSSCNTFSNSHEDTSKTDDNIGDSAGILTAQIPQSFIFKELEYEINFKFHGEKVTKELLGYIIRSNDLENCLVEYPNLDFVIYDSVYDSENNNRVPIYELENYDVSSLVGVYCCGSISVFENIH